MLSKGEKWFSNASSSIGSSTARDDAGVEMADMEGGGQRGASMLVLRVLVLSSVFSHMYVSNPRVSARESRVARHGPTVAAAFAALADGRG